MLIYRGWVPPFSPPRGLGESNQLKEGIRGAVVTPGIEVTPATLLQQAGARRWHRAASSPATEPLVRPGPKGAVGENLLLIY